jgi:TolB protein
MLRPLLVLLFAFVFTSHAADPSITIRKGGKNPHIRVTSFNAPADVTAHFKRALRISDWFDPSPPAGNAKVRFEVSGAYAPGHTLKLVLKDLSTGAGSELTVKSAKSATDAVYRGVDAMIGKAFPGQQGFCTSRLAYVKEIKGIKEIFTAEFEGSNPKQVTHNRGLSVEPDWGRGNAFMVYTVYARHQTRIVLVDMQKQRQRVLVQFPGLNSGAALSNDYKNVALTLSKDGNVELYTMNIKSRKLTRLSRTTGVESSPCWSPSDRQICFVSDAGGIRPTLYVVNASGGRAKRLLSTTRECVSPDWSAASDEICFAIRDGGAYAIATVSSSGGEPKVISTNLPGDWEAPTWAADGRHIVCSRSLGGKKELVLLDSWYERVIPLKNYTGNDTLPSYSDR